MSTDNRCQQTRELFEAVLREEELPPKQTTKMIIHAIYCQECYQYIVSRDKDIPDTPAMRGLKELIH